MSRQRVIRSGAGRGSTTVSRAAWLGAATALPAFVVVLVLTAITLAVQLATDSGFGDFAPIVATEWLVAHRVPLTVDDIPIGVLPLAAPLLIIAVVARQTSVALVDSEAEGRIAGAVAVGAAVLASLVLTGIAILVLSASSSDFVVRAAGAPAAFGWTALVSGTGAGLGLWLHHRRALREVLPMWAIGGIHLGLAFIAATWLLGAVIMTGVLLFAWNDVYASLEVGDGFGGVLALLLISIGYLPNVVMLAATVALGGEANVGLAGYGVFAVNPGPVPDMPLGVALPTSSPHWSMQLILVVTAAVAALLARKVAHWYGSIADGVKATWVAAVIVAVGTALAGPVAGGELGTIGMVGTGWLIAAGLALMIFGIIGSITTALSLAGLTRKRTREAERLEARRRAAGRARSYDRVPDDATRSSATRDDLAMDDAASDDTASDVDVLDETDEPDEVAVEADADPAGEDHRPAGRSAAKAAPMVIGADAAEDAAEEATEGATEDATVGDSAGENVDEFDEFDEDGVSADDADDAEGVENTQDVDVAEDATTDDAVGEDAPAEDAAKPVADPTEDPTDDPAENPAGDPTEDPTDLAPGDGDSLDSGESEAPDEPDERPH